MRNLHNMITAVIDVMEKHDLTFEDIARVEMEVGSINLTRCKPVHKGAIPDRRIDLLSNLPFGVAATIRHRGIPLKLFHDGKMADDVIERALPKVSWVQSERQNTKSSFEVGRAKITTTAGVVHNAECDTARGNPHNPMTFEQRRQKFYDCNVQAANPVPADRAEQIINTIDSLETLGDVGQLARLLH
jgi:2-methylcitrate dehydratase PrpD